MTAQLLVWFATGFADAEPSRVRRKRKDAAKEKRGDSEREPIVGLADERPCTEGCA